MITGIVCEYNPFHNGHLYQIEKAKAMGADKIICVMSGNFVQRGECAFFDKHLRAKAAIMCGADVVIDLPTPWAMASAETFARGSIGLLLNFGIDALEPQIFKCIKELEHFRSGLSEKNLSVFSKQFICINTAVPADFSVDIVVQIVEEIVICSAFQL